MRQNRTVRYYFCQLSMILLLKFVYGMIFAGIKLSAMTCSSKMGAKRRCNRWEKQHVVPAGDKWSIKGERNSRLTSTFDRQSDAIAAARQISKNQHSELFIHSRNGQIRERDSHGKDPFPPRG